jgi:hypothetical protein
VEEQVLEQVQLQEQLLAPDGARRKRLQGGHAIEDRKLATEGRSLVDAQPELLMHLCPVAHVEWDRVKEAPHQP